VEEPDRRRVCLGLTAFVGSWLSGCAAPVARSTPEPLQVLLSGGFAAAFGALAPIFEHAQTVSLRVQTGSSMGDTPSAIPARLARHEPADVVIMVRESLDLLVAAGQITAGSVTDLARSRIALAVRASAPVPDIGTVQAFTRTLLAAASVGVSDSASGVYISKLLYARLGIAEQMAAKSRTIAAVPVGEFVARGEVEIGMQQLSELKPIAGIRVVGLIPEAVQKVTTYSAGIVAYSAQRTPATKLIRYLASPAANTAIQASGLQPIQQETTHGS
jgi:molybdate transport system substrate-binding protein